jgi:pyruvate formate lyase activating enzyme
MTRWIVDNLGAHTPLHFTAFHPDFRMRETAPTPLETLLNARRIAMSNGLRYVYAGNVRHSPASATYCSGCGAVLIGREGYALTAWALDAGGACRGCGTPCPGVFEEAAGKWGNRREPVRMNDFV